MLLLGMVQGIFGMDWVNEKVVKPVGKATRATGRAVNAGMKKAGTDIGKKTQQVGKGVQQGTTAVVKEAQVAVKKTGKMIEKAGEFIEKEVIEPTVGAFQGLEKWRLPDSRLRLDQVTYLGAHNAHVNQKEGFKYSQQLWGLDDQLKNGVRHLLLDTWVAKSGPNKGRVMLCHGDCEKASRAQRVGNAAHVSFKTYLEKIKNFLDKNPREIVTIELESYITNEETLRDLKSVPGLFNYLLLPSDYDPLKKGGNWPTLQWMINNGKRLIIFDTGNSSQYGFNTNDYMIRNMYGTHDLNQACQIRSKPAGSKLFQLNYFGTVASPLPIHNTSTQLKKVLSRCKKNNVISSGQIPNFLSLDNVHLGNPMAWVNELNAKAAKAIK